MNRYIPVIAALALSGCGLTPAGDMVRGAVVQRGATVADKALENAVWVMCKATPVGAVVREFGVSTIRADAWRTICRTDPAAKVITAE